MLEDTEAEIWRISSGSEMRTCSDYVTRFTCVTVVSFRFSNTHNKNECAFEGPLGASQGRLVNILLKNT